MSKYHRILVYFGLHHVAPSKYKRRLLLADMIANNQQQVPQSGFTLIVTIVESREPQAFPPPHVST